MGLLICVTRLAAQIWTGANSTTWSDPLNWSGGVPGAAATATFDSNTANTPNLSGTAAVGRLLFSSGSDAETFSGLALTGTASITFSGVISGTGSFTKDGTSILTVSGANTYSGATTINAGTLRLGASDSLADTTAVTVATGATFDVNGQTETIATLAGAGTVDLGVGVLIAAGNASTTFSGVLDGTGTFTKQGRGTLTVDQDLTFAGTFNLAGGTLLLSDIALSIGTLNITGSSIIDFTGVSTLNVTNISLGVGASRLPSTTGPTPRITSSPKTGPAPPTTSPEAAR